MRYRFSQTPHQPSSIVELAKTLKIGRLISDLDCPMNKYGFREPTLQELLTEPIIQDVMRRDRVRREHVIGLFEQLRLKNRRPAA